MGDALEEIRYTPPRYLSCAETAKLIRPALKRAFPGVKFSVRSDTYANGASIHVSWVDGPRAADVEKVAGIFAGADFDGSIDLKTHSDHWLEPDGTVRIAHAQGTERSMGYLPEIIEDPPSPNAELVSFGADFVFCNRTISPEWQAEILAEFSRVIGRELGDPAASDFSWWQQVPLAVERTGEDAGRLLHMVESSQSDLSTVFHQYTAARSRMPA